MKKFITNGKIEIIKTICEMPYEKGIEHLITQLDSTKGMILKSNFEAIGRYNKYDIGFVNPPLQITVYQNSNFVIKSLNERGTVLLFAISATLIESKLIENIEQTDIKLCFNVQKNQEKFIEENRSKQLSIFSILRKIIEIFYNKEEPYLGLYGAFGYDLAFQFEAINKYIKRENDQRDLVLYLPDEILVVDHLKELVVRNTYDFTIGELTTIGKTEEIKTNSYTLSSNKEKNKENFSFNKSLEYYVDLVNNAKKAFKCGDLFEVVLGHTFSSECKILPSEIFSKLQIENPAPYSFFMNLGKNEYLVGASPEMYVRVKGKRVETCPISGTIARGKDAIADSKQILKLLNSKKDYAELTMCTDVDRNDKSRICKPNSVKVIGSRLIEMYSRLIHTVDHVEGELNDGYDAIDAFLSHAWAVTVTGAPKLHAMQYIEQHEKTPRLWYGGAIGVLNFNGSMNTGLTIRTIRIKNGIAQVRAGATLLYDSIAEEEKAEVELKAKALLSIINCKEIDSQILLNKEHKVFVGTGKNIILVDHQDSFVHTLANYLRQTGATVTTLRFGFSEYELINLKPDLVVLSPGPGKPSDFNLSKTISMILKHNIPIFGVCLGLQGIVEYFGGELNTLKYPMHGKSANIRIEKSTMLFNDLPQEITVGLYHSLYANENTLPQDLSILAKSESGIIMAIEHKFLPICAVQFHPESILSMENEVGYKIICNVIKMCKI